jgi:hypothetical protein
MAIQFSTTVRNARLDTIETTISTAPKLRIYSGTAPANAAASATGTLLVEIDLPSDWLAAASSGSKAKSGTWTTGVGGAANGGTAGYFRVLDTAGTTTHIQGTITATGGGGDMTLDSTSITAGQAVTINTFTLTDANA